MANGATIEIDVLYPAMGAPGANCNDQGSLFGEDRQRTTIPNLYAIAM